MTALRAEPLAGGDPLPWSAVTRRAAETEVYWLSTSRQDGAVHTRPVLGVWVDGALCTSVSPASAKGRNLARDPRCSVALRQDDLDVVLEGQVARVTGSAELTTIAAAYDTKYGWAVQVQAGALWAEGAPTAGPPPFHVLRLVLHRAYAFGLSGDLMGRATRWRE